MQNCRIVHSCATQMDGADDLSPLKMQASKTYSVVSLNTAEVQLELGMLETPSNRKLQITII